MRNAIVVFDTNILISGIGWQGAPYHGLELARNGKFEGVTCSELLEELMDKLTIKLKFSQQQAIDTLVDLLSFLRVVTISNTLKVIETDPEDNVVLDRRGLALPNPYQICIIRFTYHHRSGRAN